MSKKVKLNVRGSVHAVQFLGPKRLCLYVHERFFFPFCSEVYVDLQTSKVRHGKPNHLVLFIRVHWTTELFFVMSTSGEAFWADSAAPCCQAARDPGTSPREAKMQQICECTPLAHAQRRYAHTAAKELRNPPAQILALLRHLRSQTSPSKKNPTQSAVRTKPCLSDVSDYENRIKCTLSQAKLTCHSVLIIEVLYVHQMRQMEIARVTTENDRCLFDLGDCSRNTPLAEWNLCSRLIR